MAVTRVLIVDDHPLFRDGIAHMVRTHRPDWTLAFAHDVGAALDALKDGLPDLIVTDIGLPGADGFLLVSTIAERWPGLPLLVISGREDAAVRIRARAAGARAFVAKSDDASQLLATIDAVLAGETTFDTSGATALPTLTSRQAEILLLLAEGHGNKEIRHRLGIAERTVRAHLTELFQLLGVHSRAQALVRAREQGLVA